MTEAEWLASEDPKEMSEFAWGKISDRKCRLYAVACCWRVWHFLYHEKSRNAVLLAEKFADGLSPRAELDHAAAESAEVEDATDLIAADEDDDTLQEYRSAMESAGINPARNDANAAAEAALEVSEVVRPKVLLSQVGTHGAEAFGWAEAALMANPNSIIRERAIQAGILRELVGPVPFREWVADPSWRNNTTVTLAQTIYDDRAFDSLPILADALEDAGCDNAAILEHCRQPGEHVRGCWVVDLLLGQE